MKIQMLSIVCLKILLLMRLNLIVISFFFFNNIRVLFVQYNKLVRNLFEVFEKF